MAKKKRKVLLGEELKHIIEKHKGVFGRDSLEVFTADTAEEALKTHKKENVDFIVADLDMPEMGGDGLCSMIRGDEVLKRVYVTLICSGKKADIQRCGECGANNYMKKPLKTEEIAERMIRILELSARRAERVLIKVSVKGVFQNEPFFCTSCDISATGILLETDKVLARDDEITCSFFLPDLDRVLAEGKVVRVAKVGEETRNAYGVDFTRISIESKKIIDEFVNASLEDIWEK
jgi:CheY-like chemotaxis protein